MSLVSAYERKHVSNVVEWYQIQIIIYIIVYLNNSAHIELQHKPYGKMNYLFPHLRCQFERLCGVGGDGVQTLVQGLGVTPSRIQT